MHDDIQSCDHVVTWLLQGCSCFVTTLLQPVACLKECLKTQTVEECKCTGTEEDAPPSKPQRVFVLPGQCQCLSVQRLCIRVVEGQLYYIL